MLTEEQVETYLHCTIGETSQNCKKCMNFEKWDENMHCSFGPREASALLSDRAELVAEIERLMTRNEELARVVDRYTGTDYMERLHAVARAAQEIVDGLPYRGVRDFPELREELRCLKALEGEGHADE